MSCDSCGMPIDQGDYCDLCTDENGRLQSFDERFDRMVSRLETQAPTAPRIQIETETLAYMATMPAWRHHPRVADLRGI